MGNPFAAVLGGAISLVPVVLTAAAVTVVVGVAIYASEEIVKRRKRDRRCKKVKERCLATCTETTLPTPDYGAKFFKCFRACMEESGC